MNVAIEEMRLARSEHLDRPDPFVGAILVNRDGKILGRAHRGQFRDGEHGEYTLLERLLPSIEPSGCTLYVTLEPCSRREPPKKPCAQRIVEKGIGRVVVGILDPNPAIHRQGVTYLLEQGVRVDFFDSDLAEAIRQDNREFITHYEDAYYTAGVGGLQAPSVPPVARGRFSGPEREELRPLRGASIEDFSLEAIQQYLAAQSRSYGIPSEDLWTYFRKQGFLAGRADEERLIPTVAGILLFGKDPEPFCPSSVIRATRFRGTPQQSKTIEDVVGEEGMADIRGPLSKMVEDAIQFFRGHVRLVPRIDVPRRAAVPEYPEKVIRELLVNALVHRSYVEGRYVVFDMFSDRIVVASPGRLLAPLTIDDFRTPVRVRVVHRNPWIADAFSRLELMELRGFGIPTIYEELKKHGLRAPEFREELEYLVVTVYGAEGGVLVGDEAQRLLTDRQKQMVHHVRVHGRITSRECEKMFRVKRETANQDFRRLIDLGVFERRGAGRATYYVLAG
ncbi:MAG: hypothetical protein HY215_03940 [Candidatus Rokubacteria bacterium]|nr:hypothetical protein [Candidatus Rokubacteria bacterium]